MERSADDTSGAQGPLAVGIGITVTVLVGALPWILVPTWYLLAQVVALLDGRDLSAATVNVTALVLGLVAIVSGWTLLVALAIAGIGRALSPRRRT